MKNKIKIYKFFRIVFLKMGFKTKRLELLKNVSLSHKKELFPRIINAYPIKIEINFFPSKLERR